MSTRHFPMVLLLAAVIAPVQGCMDGAVAPTAIPVSDAQSARNPLSLQPVDLGTLGGLSVGRTSAASAISPSGVVVGWSTHPVPFSFNMHAVSWRDGAIIDLGTLGGSMSWASAINAAGEVAGAATLPGDVFVHAFIWRDGSMSDLGSLPGPAAEVRDSYAYGMDPSGRVVGRSDTPSSGAYHAVLWDRGTITDLGTLGGANSVAYAMNSAGDIVGSSETATGTEHAFLWRDGTMTDLGTLGGTRSVAYGINPRGDVVGSSTTANGEEHAVLWRKGVEIIDLGTLGRSHSVARGINPSGQIVGYFTGEPYSGAFIWQTGVMSELTGTPFDAAGGRAFAINPSGEVVGDAMTYVSQHAILWSRK